MYTYFKFNAKFTILHLTIANYLPLPRMVSIMSPINLLMRKNNI